VNRARVIRRFQLPLLALLSVGLASVSLTLGQDTNTPAGAAGGRTNSEQKFTPPSSNSIVFQETKARAEKGDADAQSWLGWCYASGQGVQQDYAQAVKWYRKAAEQGNTNAQFNLGCIYYAGQGVTLDYSEAVKWWRKSAEQRNPDAQNNLGLCYEMGQGVAQDYAEAANWYRKAGEQGEVSAQAALGLFYFYGQGVQQDYSEAEKWLRKAAEQGHPLAQCKLGWCYFTGQGVMQDYSEAASWSRKAAEQGNIEAQGRLGVLYSFGLGVQRDYAEAVKWWRKPAEQGDAHAQLGLATSYAHGQGVHQDYNEAVKWYQRAAEQGLPLAQATLGASYWKGKGVPKNDIEAYKWISLAAAQGDTNAASVRDRLSERITREEVVEAQRRAAAFVPRKEMPETSSNPNSPVPLRLPDFQTKASGTAFFISEDGYILTAFHVVEDAARITIRTKAGTFMATLVKADKANDVALLKVTGKFPALPVASSRGVNLGESVFTIGFPNIELQGFAPKLTKGEISSQTGIQDDPREFQISVPVQPGNSGGPLVNGYGNVVGIVEEQLADINTFKTTGSLPQNVNYAMKSTVLKLLLESLPEVSAKLKEPNSKEEKFEDAVKKAQDAVALVLVY
jgi:TPR repeat protein